MYSEQDIRNKATAHEAAAAWWANVLTDPKMDNGDQSETGAVAMMLLMQAKYSAPVISEEQLRVFEAELTRRLAAIAPVVEDHYIYLSVDYGPDTLLAECGSTAGINTIGFGIWPVKTKMWIRIGERVEVSYGYGAPTQVIWQKEPVQ